jgi:Flp pilus assembly protein TadD
MSPPATVVNHRAPRERRQPKEGAMQTTHVDTPEEKDLGLMKAAAICVLVVLVIVAGGVVIANLGKPGPGPEPVADLRGTGNAPSEAAAPTTMAVETPAPVMDLESSLLAAAPVTYAEAEAGYQRGDYAEAAELFRAYVNDHPDRSIGHYMLGLALWKAGSSAEAEEAFRRALELEPAQVKALTNLARVLLDEGRPQEALGPINRAVDLAPASADVLRVRGRVYHNLGMAEPAILSYEKALALDPGDAWALNNLGLVLIESGRFEEAIPPLARATGLRGDVATFHNNLGIALERTGRYRAAGEAYAAAGRADSTYTKAAANLARVEILKEAPGLAAVEVGALADGFKVGPPPPASETPDTAGQLDEGQSETLAPR